MKKRELYGTISYHNRKGSPHTFQITESYGTWKTVYLPAINRDYRVEGIHCEEQPRIFEEYDKFQV